MPNVHEIATEVEAVLDLPQGQSKQNVASLAVTYRTMCESANLRLRRCADYLRRGLRSEAIYHAEVEPDLLDQIAALDCRRLEEWDTLCQQNQLDRPPRLLLEIAKEINEAYAIELPMREMLRQNRLLALKRAPLRARLEVLRKLAKMDANNPIWEEDVKTFETERLKEIAAEAAQALKSKNMETAQALLREATSSSWHIVVPENLVTSLRQGVRRLQIERAISELRTLLPELNVAYSAASYEECTALLQQWDEIVSANSLSVPGDLQAQIQPIVDWVRAQEQQSSMQHQFVVACAQLEQALETETPIPDLRRLYHQVGSFEQPIPEDLERRYRTVLANRELALRRRNRIRAAMIVPTVLAAGLTVGVLLHRSNVNRRVDQICKQFLTLTDNSKKEGNFDEVRRFAAVAEQQEPRLPSRSEWVSLKEQLGKAEEENRNRVEQFEAATGSLSSSIEKAKKARQENRPEEVEAALKEARQFLATAQQLMRGSNEQLQVETQRGKIEDEEKAQQVARDDRFVNELLKLAGQFRKVDPDLVNRDPDAFAKLLTETEAAVASLRTVQGISPETMAGLEPYTQQLRSWRHEHERIKAELGKKQQQRGAIEDLVNHLQPATELAKALEAFSTAHPESDRAPAFRQAAQRAADWLAVQEGIDLARSWKDGLVPKADTDLDERLKTVADYAQKYPSSPFNNDGFQPYADYLTRAKQAMAEDSPWKANLRDLMSGPLMRDLQSVRTSEGKVYYIPTGAKITKDSMGISAEVVLTSDVTKLTRKSIKNAVGEVQPSPQVALSNDVLDMKFDRSRWDTFGIEVAEMIRSRADVDPILRATLLEEVLKQAKKANWGLDDELDTMLDSLSRYKPSDLLWMDPDDAAANASRAKIQKALDQIKSLASLKKRMEEKRQAMAQAIPLHFVGYGIALRTEKGNNWEVRTARDVPKGGMRGMVISDTAIVGKKTLVDIGVTKDEGWVIDRARLGGVPEGSMVFICQGNAAATRPSR